MFRFLKSFTNTNKSNQLKKFSQFKTCGLNLFEKYNKKIFDCQFGSDFHLDMNNGKFDVINVSDNFIIAGNVGNPFSTQFENFFSYISKKFKNIFFVAGNHDLHDYGIFNQTLYDVNVQQIIKICNKFPNVHFLNNDCYDHNDVIIVGTPLWTQLSPNIKFIDKKTIDCHNNKHYESVQYINDICKKYPTKKIVVVTHYVPTEKLIEEKYKLDKCANSKFCTPLEHIMKSNSNICVWISGHTHIVKEHKFIFPTHTTMCAINAHGYNPPNNVLLTKTFSIE